MKSRIDDLIGCRSLTMGQIIHCPMSEGVSEVSEAVSEVSEGVSEVSKRTSERSGVHEQSGASERAHRRASSPVLSSGFLIILAHCEQEEEEKARDRWRDFRLLRADGQSRRFRIATHYAYSVHRRRCRHPKSKKTFSALPVDPPFIMV